MQFYEFTTKQGICQEVDRLCDTSDTTYTRVAKTARINQAFEELVGDIITADGTWQFDDTNYTTLPIGVQTLVDGQEAYSFTDKFLELDQVEILDINGIYRKIQPIDYSEVPSGMSIEEFYGSTTTTTRKGFPQFFDVQADTIRLFPAPSSTIVTLTNGIRIRFKRTANLFTAVSTTADDATVPGGIPSTHHVLLAYMAAIPYCMSYKKDRVALYEKRRDEMKKSLLKHFALREKATRKIMRNKPINYR